MLANFLTSMVHSSSLALLSLYALKIGGSNSQAGLLTGIYSFSALVFRPVFGQMLDKHSRKTVVILGLSLITLSTVAYVFTQSISVLLIFRTINGIGFSAGSTAIATVVADILPMNRLAEGIGYFGLSNTLAQAIGPLLGLYMIQVYGYPALFIAAVGVSVASMICALPIKYTRKKEPKLGSQVGSVPKQKGFGFLEAPLIWPSILLLLTVTSNGAVLTFVASYAMSLEIKEIGMFFTVSSIGTMIARLIFGRLSKRFNLGSILFVSIILVIISQLILGTAAQLWQFLLSAVFFGTGMGCVVPIINTVVIMLASPDRKGTALSVYYCAMDMAMGLSAVIWGIIAQHFGYPAIYIAAAICCFTALMIYVFALRKRLSRLNWKRELRSRPKEESSISA
ncbi:MFS transporter [Dehalobacter sp. DCM]|nr:MFS transporter [Dehalobacter sp. DCM]